MKKTIAILCFFAINISFSQEPVSEYKYIFELSETQQTNFKIIEQDWIDEVFIPYSSKMKVKISDCKKCGALFIVVEGKIDENGRFIIDAGMGKKCSKKMILKQYKYFIDYFNKKVFPENLRNLKIQHRFGVLYKC